ncbi:hypothetical protein FGO68_gene5475 [Halteria grandinella]|uniref:HECT domain-containing protein n=1 Tax=Halteria grandinella TaxID=5974 RepID=A0A8J8NFE2_HALGN|nr:hypothetical protein FGO68_gene5475 [Halteria grandinella]
MKSEIFSTQIAELPRGERFELTIRRRKAIAFAESGECDHEGTKSIFGQIVQALIQGGERAISAFRINNVDEQVLRVEFKGEGSIDAGGPYRETLTNICKELMSGVLPLLIPTPNNKNNHGQNRESWMLNPSSTTQVHLQLFKYFGLFLGMAIRSQQALPLDLAPIFWKLLTDETGPNFQSDSENEMDLKQFDTFSWQVIQDLRQNSKDVSEEDFEYAVDENFVTLLSNGAVHELIPGGAGVKVTKKNIGEYIKLIVDARVSESARQVKAIKEGIAQIIPLSIMKILDWRTVEIRATGNKSLDIEKLKAITQYNSCQASEETIQIFWRVLESFNDEERSLYLKFVWGRSRLPATTDQKHQITAMQFNQNSCLPVSHTCFFTLDYPRYPTFELAREKILFAIMFCGDIDADRSSGSIDSDD